MDDGANEGADEPLGGFRELKLHVEPNVPVVLHSCSRPPADGKRWVPLDPATSPDCDRFDNCIPSAQWVQILTVDKETVLGYELMSPLSPTTVPPKVRRALGIALAAVEYAFLYRAEPTDRSKQSSDPVANKEAQDRNMLLENGGFVYFDSGGQVLHVNAINIDGKGWPADFYPATHVVKTVSKAVITALKEQNRLHKVRLPFLMKHTPPGKSLYFAWVHSREFDKEDAQKWCAAPDERLLDYIGGESNKAATRLLVSNRTHTLRRPARMRLQRVRLCTERCILVLHRRLRWTRQ
jgi:hypothetical protein